MIRGMFCTIIETMSWLMMAIFVCMIGTMIFTLIGSMIWAIIGTRIGVIIGL